MLNKNREQRGTGIEKVPEIAKWNGQFSGGPVQPRKVVHFVFSKPFRLDQTNPFSFGPKFHCHLLFTYNFLGKDDKFVIKFV